MHTAWQECVSKQLNVSDSSQLVVEGFDTIIASNSKLSVEIYTTFFFMSYSSTHFKDMNVLTDFFFFFF